MHDLGSFGGDFGEAHAINAAGTVVGYSSFAGGGFSHAFVAVDGNLVDLNTVTDGIGIQVLMDAVGINDAGQIVANSCNDFGFCAPVLLTPVPEPAAALLLLAGIPVLLCWARTRSACPIQQVRPAQVVEAGRSISMCMMPSSSYGAETVRKPKPA
jgi:probable HAF family extracellular repeat protein